MREMLSKKPPAYCSRLSDREDFLFGFPMRDPIPRFFGTQFSQVRIRVKPTIKAPLFFLAVAGSDDGSEKWHTGGQGTCSMSAPG